MAAVADAGESEWPDAPGPQSRACGGPGDRRDCRLTLQGADQGDTTTIVETAIAAADQIEDAQAEVQAPQPLEGLGT